MADLKPCPFCGETYIRILIDNIVMMDGHIECSGCGIEIKYSDCLQSAAEIWNKRVNDILE